MQQERWAEAEAVLRPLMQRDGVGEADWLLYGYVLSGQERWVTAESVYRQAVLAGGESVEGMYGLARCLMAMRRYDEAAAMLQELVQREPQRAALWLTLARARLTLADAEGARVALESASHFGALEAEGQVLLGDLWMQSGRSAEALAAYEAALSESAAGAAAPVACQLKAVEAALDADQADQAATWLESAADALASDDAGSDQRIQWYRLRARWATAVGEADVARQALTAWVDAAPLDVAALLALGDWYASNQDRLAAVLWYERAQRAAPRQTGPWLRLAQVALDGRDYAAAADYLERALVVGGDPAVEQTLQQVRRLQAVE
jgi:predicted Zn-dependent protease